jgi:hypothetical protein
MKKIFIVAPGDLVTGGPELLHQLADALNRKLPRARILYYPFDRCFDTPEPYRRYHATPGRIEDVDPGSIVIIPEVYAKLADQFPGTTVYFWWLSVDRFDTSAGRTAIGRFIGARRFADIQISKLRQHVAMHLYQSDYARDFLQSASLCPNARLLDYLAEEYVQAITSPPKYRREDILAYNPLKGRRQTRTILRELEISCGALPHVVPLTGMTREQILETLGRAKVYIDFGGHPGKDRIPREAAAMGACIIVNRRGSAANPVDIPIPGDFKIDDREPGFEKLAVEKIKMLMSDFERQARRFDAYRQSIAREPAGFADDVRTVFPLEA